MDPLFKYRAAVARRIRKIRIDRFGEYGVPQLAARLGLAASTWEQYEDGVMIPGMVILRFIELTGVDARWLLRGEGERYSPGPPDISRLFG
jgi:hypothetical protein